MHFIATLWGICRSYLINGFESRKFLLFQAKASSLQSLGSSVTQVIMMVQGSMLLGVGTFLTLIGAMSPSWPAI